MQTERTELTSECVVAVGQKVTGQTIEAIERLPGSVANHDFMLHTCAGDFILKASELQNLVPEAWACERVRQEGVTAPEIVWFEADAQSLPMPFLVMRRLAGQPVDEASPALAAAGEQLARVHSIRLNGYGSLEVIDGEASGTSNSWAASLAPLADVLEELNAAHVLDDTLTSGAQICIEQAMHDMQFDGHAVLLHGDLKLAHIFAASSKQVGLIDWGDARAGDPLLDLARMSMAGPTAFAAVISGYGLRERPAISRGLACYRMVWHIENFAFELRAGGDWFDHYRKGIALAVQQLT